MVQNMPTLAQSESASSFFKKLPFFVTIILLTLIAWVLASLLWLKLTPKEVISSPSTNNTQAPSQAKKTQPSQHISNLHLFGIAGEKKKKEEKITEAPDTRLNLKLRGVYAENEDGKGYALIASGSKPEVLVRIGDKLPGNIELKAVYADKVIISRSGKSETLRLPATKSTGITFAAAKNASRTPPSTSKSLKDLRTELMRNPAKLAELINAAPARKAGRFVGYRITTLKQHPILSSIDLRTGDIITRVNGVDINSASSGMKALQILSKAKQVNLSIDRNGKPMELSQSF